MFNDVLFTYDHDFIIAHVNNQRTCASTVSVNLQIEDVSKQIHTIKVYGFVTIIVW